MALILYTLTSTSCTTIALLKLMAPFRVVLGLILQQAILLGMLGYVTRIYSAEALRALSAPRGPPQ